MAIMDNPYGALAFLDRASGISRPGPTLPGVGFGQGGDDDDDKTDTTTPGGDDDQDLNPNNCATPPGSVHYECPGRGCPNGHGRQVTRNEDCSFTHSGCSRIYCQLSDLSVDGVGIIR